MITMQMAFVVATGGAAGAVLRWLIASYTSSSHLPWGTWVVNVLGSFLIGVLFVFLADRNLSPYLDGGLVVGLLGGFTTFSAFSLEVVQLVQRGQLKTAAAYLIASVVVCVLAAVIGMSVGKHL